MKVSLNTIKQYFDFDLPQVEELVNRINSQLGQVEEVIDLSDKYKDVVIVKVLSAEKHPDADRLSVCMVDDGGTVKDIERDADGHVQVVCGAPNVHADMFAAWLPPAATVPSSYSDKEPFVLTVRDIRGVKSNGMLAAADELALGSDHNGIIEINPNEFNPNGAEIKPGASFAEAFGLNDTVIDIENKMFTHRPDCFGQLGVAREIAGILGHQFNDPEWYWRMQQFEAVSGLELAVFNEAGEKVPRFMAVALKNVQVRPSPLWLQIELVRLGSKSINNVVDATNYAMLVTGQPTHAYDYEKLRGHTLGARMAKKGESALLLNGKTYELTEDDIVIVDGEGIVGLGGIMGGGNSEVSETTQTIVLEVATFDMYAVRKTSMRHGLFTDAVTRFNKGQSPLQNDRVLSKLMHLVQGTSGAEQASNVFDLHTLADVYKEQSLSGTMKVEASFINERLGLELAEKDIEQLLRNVHFACYVDEGTTATSITAPFWRTDIQLPEDIVEEVGRLYGFDKLHRELPLRSITPAAKNPMFELKQEIRNQLSRQGANEVLTYSFVHEDVLKKAGQNSDKAYRLNNALSPDLQYYRLSLTPSLLDKVHPNIKSGHDEFALFEIGKAHIVGQLDDEGLPQEFHRLAFVYASKSHKEGAAFYKAKTYLTDLLLSLGVSKEDIRYDSLTADEDTSFEPKRGANVLVGGEALGRVGEYKSGVARGFKLPPYSAGFEISITMLAAAKKKRTYKPLPRFPKVTQDISLKVPNETPYAAVFDSAARTVAEHKPGDCDTSLEPLSIYQPEGGSHHKTITLRLSIASYEKTLTDKDVNQIMDSVANEATKEFNALRV